MCRKAAQALILAMFQTSAEEDEGAAAATTGEKGPRWRPRWASGAKPTPTRAVGRDRVGGVGKVVSEG